MANVSFYVGSATPGSSGLTTGGLYVDSSGGQLYYATSATAKKQIGSSMKMMADKGWTLLNGTTGTLLSDLSTSVKNTIVNYASEVYIQYRSVPFSTAFPNISGYTQTQSLGACLHRAYNNAKRFAQQGLLFCATTTGATFSGGPAAFYTLSITFDNTISASINYYYCNSSGNMQMNTRTNEANSYLYVIGYKF